MTNNNIPSNIKPLKNFFFIHPTIPYQLILNIP